MQASNIRTSTSRSAADRTAKRRRCGKGAGAGLARGCITRVHGRVAYNAAWLLGCTHAYAYARSMLDVGSAALNRRCTSALRHYRTPTASNPYHSPCSPLRPHATALVVAAICRPGAGVPHSSSGSGARDHLGGSAFPELHEPAPARLRSVGVCCTPARHTGGGAPPQAAATTHQAHVWLVHTQHDKAFTQHETVGM